MAEETVIVEEKKKVKEREPLFSKKNKKLITSSTNAFLSKSNKYCSEIHILKTLI